MRHLEIMSTLFFPKIVVTVSFLTLAFAVTPKEEVQALRDIAKTMGKADYWNFSIDPCSVDNSEWVRDKTKDFMNAVTCNCTVSNDDVCHVVSIVIKRQSLPGKLPPELVRLPYLQEIDLTLNYLNGTIPPEWGSMKLVNISILGNRVSGSIPKEIANISTLKSLTAEYNQISGSLPPEIGSLPSLERLCLSSNNLSGELPPTLAKLTTLKDFRISDNHFTGKMPNYIQNWTMLKKLFIQASGLTGPIPSGLADLVNLIELRISDLNGSIQSFPPLQNMQKMEIMMLRSCNISGELPGYLGNMVTLKTLDLSFNKLSGEIPSNFSSLADVDYIYLTGNLLTGTVPQWILNRGDKIDLSYNNFPNPNPESCESRLVNFFGSSLKRNNSGIIPCSRTQCPKRLHYSLNINCGGKEVHVSKDITYEDDTSPGGPKEPSFFQNKSSNWAYSNTGNFLDDKRREDFSVSKNASRLSMNNSELYMTARLSPLSLTYYGYCLGNGNYTVDLHFAEIMFTGDKNYSSLGKRLFDVYIQGKLVLKDFNIAAEAGGVGKAIIKNFTAPVTDNTLEIRFYWAGKGTDAIPSKGVYGPLISAISVNPADFNPPKVENSGLSAGMISGIVAGVCLILLVVGLIWWKCCIGQRNTMSEDLRSLELKTGSFTLRQIKAATNNFDIANKIGEGGFGSVYKGLLLDGTGIAVKQLSSKSKQGNREFVNEIGMISALDHPHLVKLYGCCIEGKELLLIYEYLENNCLARALFGGEEHLLDLDWPTRQKICVGIAKGLAYLHEESRLKIVHRDIKATNVLLDKDLNAKISDFGLAKLDEEDNTHISTRIAGTLGYMAPEYAMRGYLTDKADVYSFGIVALEIVSGRSNTNNRRKEDCFNLLDWALVLKDKGTLMDMVDPRLGSDFNPKEVMTMINVALLCADVSPSVRPSMSSVVSILEGKSSIPEFVTAPSASDEGSRFETVKKNDEQVNDEYSASYSEVQCLSIGPPSTVSSSSAVDLYPIGSDYWENRDRR